MSTLEIQYEKKYSLDNLEMTCTFLEISRASSQNIYQSYNCILQSLNPPLYSQIMGLVTCDQVPISE